MGEDRDLKSREGLEDVYDFKSPTKGFFLLIAIIFVAIAAFWFFSFMQNPYQNDKSLKTCENMMLEKNSKYIICCIEDGKISDCSQKKIFRHGDFVIVHANIAAFENQFTQYYACAFYTPLKTSIKSQINETTEEVEAGNEMARCSKRLYGNYYAMANFGNIKITGEITLMRLYIYPPLGFNMTYDFIDNTEKAIQVLDLRVNVE